MENEPIDKTHKIFRFMGSVRLIGNWIVITGMLILLVASLVWGNAAMFFTCCIPGGLWALIKWDQRRCKKKYGKDWRRKGGWLKSDSSGD